MKPPDLMSILARERSGEGPVNVLVALHVGKPDAVVLRRLEGLGLKVNQVVHNKVLGSIPGERLRDLQEDPAVAEVERSVPLKPH